MSDPAPRSPAEQLAPPVDLPTDAFGVLDGVVDLLELAKIRITLLVSLTAVGACLAAGGGGAVLSHLVGGTVLLVGGANALNQVLERDADGSMGRTRDRPVAAGRIPAAGAAGAGTLLCVAGIGWLWAATNPLTAGLGAGAALLYLGVYTPLKRRSPASLLVGAVPGALPALGGWTAVRARVDATGLALFAILFLWQLPHFLALGRRFRDQYRAAGFAVWPVGEGGASRSDRIAVLSTLALLPVSVAPALLGTGGLAYCGAALLAGGYYIRAAVRFATTGEGRAGGRPAARSLFRVSLYYLPLLLGALVIDQAALRSGRPPIEMLPEVNAGLNGVAALCLVAGFLAIRRGKVETHRSWMLTSGAASALFLGTYLVYHARVGSVPFGGHGLVRALYLAILVSHVVLAIAVVPAAIVTVVRGLSGKRAAHRRLARKLLPVWLYVSVTGVIVYWMVHRL